MKKTAMLLFIICSLASCTQEDEGYSNLQENQEHSLNNFYSKGEEETKDSITFPDPVQETDGDPPPKEIGGNGNKP
ncbi:MAG: hypothetical protein WCY25_06735 [Moheibacter sp.]